MASIEKNSKMSTSIMSNLNNFHSLEVVDRVNETQLQVKWSETRSLCQARRGNTWIRGRQKSRLYDIIYTVVQPEKVFLTIMGKNDGMLTLCIWRLNWARRTSLGQWDDTAPQTQKLIFEPWRSEAEHATSPYGDSTQYWISRLNSKSKLVTAACGR